MLSVTQVCRADLDVELLCGHLAVKISGHLKINLTKNDQNPADFGKETDR